MSLSLVDAVRINRSTWGASSVLLTIDGQATESFVAIDYEERLELRIISSNIQDNVPLGMSLGRYQVGTFPLTMLRDGARAFKTYLTSKAPAAMSGSFGQATFDMGLSLSSVDSSNVIPSTTVFISCRVVGEQNSRDPESGALVTEFTIAALAIAQDGMSLFDATGLASAGLPGTDKIAIAGIPAPGKWTLLRAPRKFGWDVRKGAGLSGATVVPTGDELVVARFLVEIWDPADYLLFNAFRSQYLKKQLVSVAGSPQGLAIGIDHPELKQLGATSFVVQEVNPLVNDSFGVWSAEVEFLEYRRPLPALSKPAAAIPDVSAPAPTAQDQADVEIQKLTAQLQALAAQ
jgi:hypothetical protein